MFEHSDINYKGLELTFLIICCAHFILTSNAKHDKRLGFAAYPFVSPLWSTKLYTFKHHGLSHPYQLFGRAQSIAKMIAFDGIPFHLH